MKSDKKNTKLMLKNFKRNKVNTKFIEFDKNHHNDYTRIDIALNGDNTLYEHSDISKSYSEEMIKNNAELIKNADYVVMQLKVPNKVTRELFKICKKQNVKTVLTPCRPFKARNNPRFIEDATYITCNLKEATEIFGIEENGNFVFGTKELNNILRRYPNKLIVTLGKKGVKWFDGKKICFEKSIEVDRVIDTTGAGDTFCGNFVSCLQSGEALQIAIRKGICASAIKIQKAGTQDGMPTKKERDKLYRKIYTNED